MSLEEQTSFTNHAQDGIGLRKTTKYLQSQLVDTDQLTTFVTVNSISFRQNISHHYVKNPPQVHAIMLSLLDLLIPAATNIHSQDTLLALFNPRSTSDLFTVVRAVVLHFRGHRSVSQLRSTGFKINNLATFTINNCSICKIIKIQHRKRSSSTEVTRVSRCL